MWYAHIPLRMHAMVHRIPFMVRCLEAQNELFAQYARRILYEYCYNIMDQSQWGHMCFCLDAVMSPDTRYHEMVYGKGVRIPRNIE